MIAVPCVQCVATQTLAQCWHWEEETLFILSGLEEGGRALSRALPTPTLSLSAGLPCPLPDYNHVLTHSTCPKNKRDRAWGLNPDGVYASRVI